MLKEIESGYMKNTITNKITNAEGQTVTRVWCYPVRQAILGGHDEVLRFASREERDAYIAKHDYCDKLPREKAFSDQLVR